MKFLFSALLFLCILQPTFAQKKQFTRQDTLRGSITPERAWWDLVHYDLDVQVFPQEKALKGSNTVTYKVLQPKQRLQIDLQEPMQLLSATQHGKKLQITSEGSAHFITLLTKQPIGSIQKITLQFEGKPVIAKNSPWDGGWTWQKDSLGKPFIANANQGIGASVWWPNKDHPYDEVDSLDLRATAPQRLMAVSNGRLVDSISAKAGTMTYHWTVKNPINNYGVNINIADYAHFSDYYNGEKGKLDLNFYVLKQNLAKAKKQFAQVPEMLEAFEYWMGPYPFYEDTYKLVEVPYLGMEHQSSVTYGNKYANGYLGRDLSGSGWGNKFDYIIIHESAHEWFANNITCKDVADMWIQEGFATYAENLFVDYHFGKKASSEYVLGQRKLIRNDSPIIGIYGVDNEGSSDMYFKGANILNSLRYIINDDQKWREILRDIGSTFYHQTVTSETIENYISEQSGMDLKAFFDQYLRTIEIPQLEYTIEADVLRFRYTDSVAGFNAPIDVNINGKKQRIIPTEEWAEISFEKKINAFEIDPNFYIESLQTN